MTIATGVNKKLKYKAEATWGVPPAAAAAQALRRVTSTLNLRKATYESNELSPTMQRRDYRHGTRTVEGSINGELSPGTYKDFFAAAVRRAFTTVTAISGLSITITGTGPTWNIARGAGSWLTDGIKAHQVGRLTAGAFNAANLNKNLQVLVATASNLTVMPVNGAALVAEGAIAASTWTVPGKVTFAPPSGHTDVSFSVEHFHSDLAPTVSEVYSGCKINRTPVDLPATGISTVAFEMMGKDLVRSASEYFTSPTVETTSGVLAAVNGVIVVQGAAVALVTGLNFQIDDSMTAEPVVGSNTYADVAEGRILGQGQLTALFQDVSLRDLFVDETEASLVVTLTTSNAAAADFLLFGFPRCKVGGADKDDGDKSIIQTLPFVPLYNDAGGAGVATEQTTLYLQDSLA